MAPHLLSVAKRLGMDVVGIRLVSVGADSVVIVVLWL